MVGGAPVTRRWADEIGADGYAKDAMSAVALARELMEQRCQNAVVSPCLVEVARVRCCVPHHAYETEIRTARPALIERILEEAFQLIEDPGVRVAPYVVDCCAAPASP